MTDDHPNIILILADDLWFGDLPWYSPPIKWLTDPSTVDPSSAEIPEYRIQQPTLNRFAARLLADSNGTSGNYGAFPMPPENALGSTSTTLTSGSVKPIDDRANDPSTDPDYALTTECRNTSHTKTCRGSECSDPAFGCDRRRDVLEGFGGFKRIAQGGAVFGRYYSVSAYCGPARASLITGRHTKRTMVGSNGGHKLAPEEVFISEWLRQGCPSAPCFLKSSPENPTPCATHQPPFPCYYTGYFGKWHLGPTPPWDQGFVESAYGVTAARAYFDNNSLHCGGNACPVGYTTTTLPNGSPRGGCCANWDEVRDVDGTLAVHGGKDLNGTNDTNGMWPCNDDSYENTNKPDDSGCPYSQRVFEILGEDFIDRALADAAAGNSDGFFLMLSLNAVHIPRSAPKRTTAHYDTTPSNSMLDPRGRDRGDVYWAVIEEIDASIGKLYKKLDDEGILYDTIVLFTSDHGGPTRSYGIPDLRGGKGGVHEGAGRVGLLASACAHSVGDRSSHVANHTDLFPTIAEAAGAKVDAPLTKPIDGVSFYNVLKGGPAYERDYTFFRYHGETINARPGRPDGVKGVCGYSALTDSHVVMRAGSCHACTPGSSECQNPTNPIGCTVLGKVCVSDTNSGTCDPMSTCPPTCDCTENVGCPSGTCIYSPTHPSYSPAKLHRCINNTDCKSGESCKEVSVLCNECPLPAWRLRTPPDVDSDPIGHELYDLATNPEEVADLDCNHYPASDPMEATGDLLTIRTSLRCRVRKWWHCTAADQASCLTTCDKKWGRDSTECIDDDNFCPPD